MLHSVMYVLLWSLLFYDCYKSLGGDLLLIVSRPVLLDKPKIALNCQQDSSFICKIPIPKYLPMFGTAAACADKTKPKIGINTLFLSRATDQLDTGTVPHVANLGKTSDLGKPMALNSSSCCRINMVTVR